MSAHTHGNDMPTHHGEEHAGAQPSSEATCPLKSILVEPQTVLGDFQKDEDQLKTKILIRVERKNFGPADVDSMGRVKEKGMIYLGKVMGER